jgi:hypothetical protein
MLATALVLALVVALLQVLDFFLTEKQKGIITNWLTDAWNWLDEIKTTDVVDRLHRPWLIELSVGTVALIVIAVVVEYTYHDFARPFSLYRLLAVPFGLAVASGYFAGKWIARSGTILSFAKRTILVAIAVGAIPLLDLLVSRSFFTEDGNLFPYLLTAWLISAPIAAVLVLILITAVMPLMFAYLGASVIYIGEYLIRKVTEYPKGPILAICLLVGAIVAMFKVFGYG